MMDRRALAILRISIGLFFFFEGMSKFGWFGDPSILRGQLAGWMASAPPSSVSHAYLERFAMPGVAVFARLVPLGEMMSGVAIALGAWPRLFALIAFLMALNFHVASGALFKYSFLTNGYGLPVLGSTLAVALAGGTGARAVKRARVKV